MFKKSIIANLENRGINITNSSLSNAYDRKEKDRISPSSFFFLFLLFFLLLLPPSKHLKMTGSLRQIALRLGNQAGCEFLQKYGSMEVTGKEEVEENTNLCHLLLLNQIRFLGRYHSAASFWAEGLGTYRHR